MLYELCTQIQGFLHTYNEAPRESFYEEMLKNQQKQKDLDDAKQQKRLNYQKLQEEKQVVMYDEHTHTLIV